MFDNFDFYDLGVSDEFVIDDLTTDQLTTDGLDVAMYQLTGSDELQYIYFNWDYPKLFFIIFGAVFIACALSQILFGGK